MVIRAEGACSHQDCFFSPGMMAACIKKDEAPARLLPTHFSFATSPEIFGDQSDEARRTRGNLVSQFPTDANPQRWREQNEQEMRALGAHRDSFASPADVFVLDIEVDGVSMCQAAPARARAEGVEMPDYEPMHLFDLQWMPLGQAYRLPAFYSLRLLLENRSKKKAIIMGTVTCNVWTRWWLDDGPGFQMMRWDVEQLKKDVGESVG